MPKKITILVSIFFLIVAGFQPVIAAPATCNGIAPATGIGKCSNNNQLSCRTDFDCVVGKIENPNPAGSALSGSVTENLLPFLNRLLVLVFITAGLFAFWNIIAAGFQFVSSGGDAKAISAAWGKITWSFMGLVVLVSSFLLAALAGIIFFGRPDAILNPKIP